MAQRETCALKALCLRNQRAVPRRRAVGRAMPDPGKQQLVRIGLEHLKRSAENAPTVKIASRMR